MTPDKNTLDLARVFAESVESRPSAYDEQVRSAAEVVSSLPDSWVDADTLRKYIADWREGLATAPRGNYEAEMLDDLESLLPAPPAPRTMAEIEWSFSEHHRAEAEHSVYGKVVMMELDGTGDIVVLMDEGLLSVSPSALTPTGRKLRLEPEDDVAYATGGALTTQDVVDECRAVRKERAAAESASPRTMDEIEWDDEPEFDPAYLYRDKDGTVWGYLDGAWRGGSQLQGAYTAPPTRFGPYTRIEKDTSNE